MGFFKKRKQKKKQKAFAKSMDIEMPVENTGNFFYNHFGIISIAATVITAIPIILMFSGMTSSFNFSLLSAYILVVPGSIAILGYILYYKDKKKKKGGFKQ